MRTICTNSLFSAIFLISYRGIVKSVVEITLGNLIQPLYLVSSKTEGVAPITYLISKDILTLILYSTSVEGALLLLLLLSHFSHV